MNVIPAIDILNGKCVQLVGGKLGTESYYGDPERIAGDWIKKGAKLLHVIDLDATLGTGDNTEILKKIRKSVKVPIQFGGGVRSIEKARELLEKGIDKVIIGTLAVNDYVEKTGKLEKLDKERVIAAVDSSKGFVVIKGWQEKSMIKTTELMKGLENKVWGFLYTNVDVEGQMKGIDIESIKEVVKATKKPVIISGGISSEKDIKDIEKTGAWGVVLGKALYEGKIKLS